MRFSAATTNDEANSTRTMCDSTNTAAWDDEIVDLYATHFDSLVGSARRYLHGREAAEEAVQEAFVRFHQNGSLGVANTPVAYLRTMVVNNARTMVRRQACRDRYRPTETPFSPGIEDACIASDRAAMLREACITLSDRQREVLTLRYWGDLSEAEIATQLGISAGAVKTHASRGRATLRELLAGQAA